MSSAAAVVAVFTAVHLGILRLGLEVLPHLSTLSNLKVRILHLFYIQSLADKGINAGSQKKKGKHWKEKREASRVKKHSDCHL